MVSLAKNSNTKYGNRLQGISDFSVTTSEFHYLHFGPVYSSNSVTTASSRAIACCAWYQLDPGTSKPTAYRMTLSVF